MTAPTTLLALAGANLAPASLSQAALVIVDAQNEYLDGTLALPGIQPALDEIGTLLERTRAAGRPVIHVRHLGQPGGLFDAEGRAGQIVDLLTPLAGETVIGKRLPNSFAGTDLKQTIDALGVKQLVVTGFMTHMCISATVRSAVDQGLFSTVVASTCATRDLPSATGGAPVPAKAVHDATLAALADRFAVVAEKAGDVPD
ncbi:cysteine hydrolase family protein [Microbaculum marinisediminis]|uniref:Cysteine hydrolase n=1 Tax=Microbaculum marinisediminis TaxID=2931392 RepID=A0AAW5QQN9_9HYPH|nr:cysteine hydrolase family protein [Microbaculum sp. A6E488]MCT8970290.1 cysteine hydrolase [Microbaculum sp. A6E488]